VVYSVTQDKNATQVNSSDKVNFAYYPIISTEHPYTTGKGAIDPLAVLVKTQSW
jgi:hypothetical protein